MRKLQEEYLNYLNKRFYQKNDKAHRIDHIITVLNNAASIVKNQNDLYNGKIVFVAISLHDIFCSVDRAKHNNLIRDYLINKDYLNDCIIANMLADFSDKELELIIDMVYWHRSSLNIAEYKPRKRYFLKYVNLIRYADKGAPMFKPWLERTMAHNNGNIQEVKKHFEEKFLPDGYAWKNDPGYKNTYLKEYEVFQKELSTWLKDIK